MKFIIGILFSIALSGMISAQPAFKFYYDDSGNRIKREVIDLSELPSEDPEDPELNIATNNPDELKENSKINQAHEQTDESTGKLNDEISVYPNPIEDIVFVDIENYDDQEKGTFQIVSMNGKTVFTQNILATKSKLQLSGLATGDYILRVRYKSKLSEWVLVKD